jgi:D-alanyl-D-alanine carboxypeptidase
VRILRGSQTWIAAALLALSLAGWLALSGNAAAGRDAAMPGAAQQLPDTAAARNGAPARSEPGSAESASGSKSIGNNDWRLLLVNPWNSLPDDFEVALTKLKDGHAVDERCYPDLQQMMDDCRAAGLQPMICSSYRTREDQQKLFNNLVSQGRTYEEAATSIAVPGTSEHQTGLALDIVDRGNQNLDDTQEDTPVQQWLMENSWHYGFILRYPSGKTDITGYHRNRIRTVALPLCRQRSSKGTNGKQPMPGRISDRLRNTGRLPAHTKITYTHPPLTRRSLIDGVEFDGRLPAHTKITYTHPPLTRRSLIDGVEFDGRLYQCGKI